MATKTDHQGRSRAELADLPACSTCGRQIGLHEPYAREDHPDGSVVAKHTIPLEFDECAVAVRKTLEKLGFCLVPALPDGTGDVDWLEVAGRNEWSVVTEDARIARNPDELATVIENKAKCFILPPSNNKW